ncbi:MAG TPA: VOC family protein [Burkholderiaceae bacterium]|jgi:predicted 3-demethylubiquinone-9 3-methyltransferase (glyoxalase superfamily)
MNKIYPCLWFDGQAEQAMKFYLGIFPNAKVTDTLLWGDVGPGPKGSLLTCSFELDGQAFMALNGGPQYQFTPAISLVVNCETQAEVDRYWDKLLDGGQAMACGWVTDKFGVSWQITPTMLPKLLMDPDAAKAGRVMAAMMQMVKLDIATLQKAADAR